MPIFEYRCEDCGRAFEMLKLSSNAAAAACLHCASTRVKKLFSSFATSTAGSSPSAGFSDSSGPACGRCGSSNPCGSD